MTTFALAVHVVKMSSKLRHRSSLFKQNNKPHKKGRSKTKGELKEDRKGRVSVKAPSRTFSKEVRKTDRKNKQKQLRANKREEVLQSKRLRGTGAAPPHLVAVLPLSQQVDTASLHNLLCQVCECENDAHQNKSFVTTLIDSSHKCRFSLVYLSTDDLYAVLDIAKVVDTLVLVHKAGVGLDDDHSLLLDCCMAQGLPTTLHLIQGLHGLKGTALSGARRVAQKTIETRYPSDKLLQIDTEQDARTFLWAVQSHKRRLVLCRDRHSLLLVEKSSFSLDHTLSRGEEEEDSSQGTLLLTGYVRSRPLSVNSLLHIPGRGTFNMKQIDSCPDPALLRGSGGQAEMQTETVRVLEVADVSKQESLISEVTPDPMDGEQTWPSEQELKEAEDVATARSERRQVRRVPKGTSDYQATWIVPEEEEEGDQEDESVMDEEEAEELEGASLSEEELSEEEEEISSIGITDEADMEHYDADDDAAAEEQQVQRLRAEGEHKLFPDEVNTPFHMQARVRFQKYRGLKSFRSSPWDPRENLPPDYSRIFQFANFKLTKKRVLAQREGEGALPGWYVTLHVANVPQQIAEQLTEPLVVYSLLPHENKMSVLHFLIRRTNNYTLPIKSKDSLVFHSGLRRFTAGPIFSQHTSGDKHKLERYLPAGNSCMASVYAPISFPPQPLLLFQHQQLQDGRLRAVLVATGSLNSVAPSRVICKRIVLSGHPYKINKRAAVIRYMFFNTDDIDWFKPVELKTKHGRRGHIKESLGTHGHMKCIFDGQLKAQDTILMTLYKRVFPKWTYSEMDDASCRTVRWGNGEHGLRDTDLHDMET